MDPFDEVCFMSPNGKIVWEAGPAEGFDTFMRIEETVDVEFLHQLVQHKPIDPFPQSRYKPSGEFNKQGDAGFVGHFRPLFLSLRAFESIGQMPSDSGQIFYMETTVGAYKFHCTRSGDILALPCRAVVKSL